MLHADQAPTPHSFDHLCIEQLREWHPARLQRWTFILAA
jgi:hypothetical protein